MELILKQHGGVVSARQLRSLGMSDWEIRKLCRNGALARLRPGWYADPSAMDTTRRAVALGGCLSCVSALKHHGLWVPPHAGLHVRRSERLRNATIPSGVHICRPPGRFRPVHRSIDSVRMALLAASKCVAPDDLVVLMDSVCNRSLMTRAELDTLFVGTPAQHLLSKVDTAESGTETYVRLRLRRLGIKLRVQVEFLGIGRVDFLIGDRLILEVDSRAHHEDPEAHARDRRRDRKFRRYGYNVVRVTYAEVMTPALWADVEADLLVMIRRGDHRSPRHRKAV